jgi:hypothetical protein
VKTSALLFGALAVVLVAFLASTQVRAAPRTWVSSSANVGNPCTRASPCAVFQEAHDATDDGGVINCVDGGEFSVVTISKSITIDCTGVPAGIGASGGLPGISIDTPGIVVTVRGLWIDGGLPINAGSAGILFQNGAELHVENCRISGFKAGEGQGIHFRPTQGTSKLYVSDSIVSDNGLPTSGGGIVIAPGGSLVQAMLERVQVIDNTYGIFANGTLFPASIAVQVRDSVAAGNNIDGISAYTSASGAVTSVTVEGSASVLNGGNGILSQGAKGFVLLANSTVTSNGVGLSAPASGNIFTYGNNQLKGNVTAGAPTATLNAK